MRLRVYRRDPAGSTGRLAQWGSLLLLGVDQRSARRWQDPWGQWPPRSPTQLFCRGPPFAQTASVAGHLQRSSGSLLLLTRKCGRSNSHSLWPSVPLSCRLGAALAEVVMAWTNPKPFVSKEKQQKLCIHGKLRIELLHRWVLPNI